jgi:N-glycosylase/DNA lyase
MPIATALDSGLPVSTVPFNASPCASSADPDRVMNETSFTVRDYDLAATLGCGQAFRWEHCDDRWRGIVDARWVELRQHGNQIFARTAEPQTDWRWLEHYLQLDLDLAAVLATFPDDEPMRRAVAACRGLRLLRQPVWECLASFILSSTKQIVQIRQIIGELCTRHGDPVRTPESELPAFAFPRAEQIAALSEQKLRDCKMGFRAPYLLATARAVAGKQINLTALPRLRLAEARAELLKLPGIGPKIADCVLLFAGGFPTAFPVDVWVTKSLRQSYFHNRRVNLARLRSFSATHFGPHGGYAQQYLFHSLRLHEGKKLSS